MKKKDFGFTFIELIISLTIFSTVFLIGVSIMSLSLKSSVNTEEYTKVNLLILEKINFLQGLGFWVWLNIDTANPSFPNIPNLNDPAITWRDDLNKFPYHRRGTLTAKFQKLVSGNLVAFTGAGDFEGNADRNIINIDIAVATIFNKMIKNNLTFSMYSSPEKVRSLTGIMKIALKMHYNAYGIYPSNGNLGLLVDRGFLPEIPNDPYTTVLPKVTHKEDLVDWHYDNSNNRIILEPNSHREDVRFIETWTY